MKKLFYLFIATFAFLHVSATKLNYIWKANTAYNFNATVVDNISTSAMGMNINEKYVTTVDFTLFIQSVQPNGTATGRMYLTNFNVKNSAGVSVASMLNLPKDAVKSEFQVDKKGNFTFLKKVYLVTTPTSNVMVYANASENSANAGIQVGEEKVDAYAEFDEDSESKKPTVQVGDPFTEKLLLEACLELMQKKSIVSIQDMGAAGLTSSSIEMASKGDLGIKINLNLIPCRENNMTPYEIMLSESQERMLMVLKKGKEKEARKIFEKWGLDFAIIGQLTNSRHKFYPY